MFSMALEDCMEGGLHDKKQRPSVASRLMSLEEGMRRLARNQVIANEHMNDKLYALSMELIGK